PRVGAEPPDAMKGGAGAQRARSPDESPAVDRARAPVGPPCGTAEIVHGSPAEPEGMRITARRVGAADRLTVDGGGEGHRGRTSERAEATHRGAVPQERTTLGGAVQCRTHHLATVVDAVPPARVATERGQRIHRPGLLIEPVGMVDVEVAGRA